jgi:hypothetical protein
VRKIYSTRISLQFFYTRSKNFQLLKNGCSVVTDYLLAVQ